VRRRPGLHPRGVVRLALPALERGEGLGLAGGRRPGQEDVVLLRQLDDLLVEGGVLGHQVLGEAAQAAVARVAAGVAAGRHLGQVRLVRRDEPVLVGRRRRRRRSAGGCREGDAGQGDHPGQHGGAGREPRARLSSGDHREPPVRGT
jgi:hypothetical protein